MSERMQVLIEGLRQAPELTFAALFLLALFVFGIYRFLSFQARRRLMEDMPTSRIRSASQGYVELEGVARLMDGLPILSPLTQNTCCWYRYKVEKREQSENRSRWVTVRWGVSPSLFLIEDDTGECVIDPEGGLVDAAWKQVWYGPSANPYMLTHANKKLFGQRDYRYTEEIIQPGEYLYALGWFTSFDPAHVSLHERVRDTVVAWKNDPEKRRRFDANGDGKLDIKEFEALRAEARRQAEVDHRQHTASGQTHLLRREPSGQRPLLLSTHDQHTLASRLRRQAWFWLFAALAGLSVCLHLITQVLPSRVL